MLHILNHQNDEILDYIVEDDIFEDRHYKSLEDTMEKYDSIVRGDQSYVEYLTKRNRIIVPDDDGSLREMVLNEILDYKDTEGQKTHFFCYASYLDLKKASVVLPDTYDGLARQHIGRSLNDTGWYPGIIEVAGDISIEVETHTNPYSMLRRIAREFGGELRFRIEHDGNRITGRYVDLLSRIGSWRGKEATFGKDLDRIKRIEKQDIVTALLGIGPEQEDNTLLSVFVEDKDALERWGRIDPRTGELKHLVEVYNIQSERMDMTEEEARKYTRAALNKRIDSQVTYETTILDLADVAGLEHEEMFFGDTIRIKDTDFVPPLYLEARIFEMVRSIKRKAKQDIKLGDYTEFTEKEVDDAFSQFKKQIQERLEKLVTLNIVSDNGVSFKNGEGSTTLTADTIVNGSEYDEDGVIFEYDWFRYINGELDEVFNPKTKSIVVSASDITDKAVYRVYVGKNSEVYSQSEVTVTNVYDGEKGQDGTKGDPGEDGKDGKSTYTHVRYSQNKNGIPMSSDPEDAVYIGIAITDSDFTPSDPGLYSWFKGKGDKGDQGLQGLQGEDGDQGIPGEDGEDGKTSYTHIAYADTDTGEGFSQNPPGKPYVGMYVDFEEDDSTDPSKYKWSLIKGKDGDQGIPGQKGEDGKTPYFHTAWANNETGTSGFSTSDSINKLYIGTYTDFEEDDSTDPSKYKWTKIKGDKGDKGEKGEDGAQGIQGPPGSDGSSQYIHIRYSPNSNGNPMTKSPNSNTKYIGIVNSNSPTAPSGYSSYTWSKFKGEQGNQGIPGTNGTDGTTTYTWVKYADTSSGGGINDSPSGKKYIGLAFNKTSQSESSNPSDYTWSLIKGEKGDKGDPGPMGTPGNPGPMGDPGKDGESGRGVIDIVEQFYLSTSDSTQTGGSWVYVKPAITANKFLWKRDRIQYTTSPIYDFTTPILDDSWAAFFAADGKTTIIFSKDQPSTQGRKPADTWFKEMEDGSYVMYKFDGNEWKQSKFGEQAIIADSITANHIKSLAGLDVGNGQFVVDVEGNVRFAGNLDGASGTFGKVSVTSENFSLTDEVSGLEFSAVSKRNLLKDHSFELLPQDPESINQEALNRNYLGVKPNKGPFDPSPWERSGSPKVAIQFAPDSPDAIAYYGDKAAVVRSGDFYKQFVYEGIAAGGVYTASGYFKRQWNCPAGGEPTILVRRRGASGNLVSTIISEGLGVVKEDYTVERKGVSFTVPSDFENDESLEIIFSGRNNKWVQVDGVLLNEGDRPSNYDSEDSIWEMTKGGYSPNNKMPTLWVGNRYMTANQTTVPERAITDCTNGWILQWQAYDPGTGAVNTHYQYTHIPKAHAMYNSGRGIRVILRRNLGDDIIKYIYINDTGITGHDGNGNAPNNRMALSGVYEY